MERMWEGDTAHANFFRKLLNSRVDELVNSPEWLKRLRFRNDEVKWWNKKCGRIFEERALNLYHLIAQAYGECWDSEDEQKCVPAEENVDPPIGKEKPRHAISLDHPRESGVRQGQEKECELQVRAGDEGREGDLQEGRKEDRKLLPQRNGAGKKKAE